MANRRVLVTGLSGAVGSAIRPALEERYEVAALSRSGVDGIPSALNFKGPVQDAAAIAPAFEGVDTVIHLAADGGAHSSEGMNAGWESMLQNNVIGAYNVFEAARAAGVKRVIFASTGATVIGYEQESPWSELVSEDDSETPNSWPNVTRDSEPKPHSLYGASKLIGEDLARYFVNTTDMSIICLRIGGVGAQDVVNGVRGRSIYCSHADMAQMAVKCVEAPDTVRFDIFYVVSDNKYGYRDISHARDVVGYEPTGSAERSPMA
ncbi:MAG: NAD(P)-dependent oxidoreductase [Chloroflexi bacterium]|jgi:nucleoside-diphosphate-sugar epimerase|nr:NAD(P)-dependent oxidoreductase [Chloroflexota bacterium]MBT4074701.1 NAD(P)-dependent oxidoreductase [Chloroflexota bacterium]MBT4514546.1 NAD(P)-dependent oxidoreductase [Chloroflexota bacterium]MBT5319779.1 NAD(P)-dependent oxidoreductase [Chloroflexota bacterium]MBT6682223.1 NAD(P)-dependent oxidoreductase [Chloroflexota bacterium]